jgi:hypothetical protein
MRPWKIVLSSAVAAICAAVAMARPGLAVVSPDGVQPWLLTRLPALGLTLIAVYALTAIVLSAGGLIAAALDLRRDLDRTDAVSQVAAALDWIAAFDATPLRTLVPRPLGALPKSAKHNTTILLDARFDPRDARAGAAHVYYLWLARTHSIGALVCLAAIGALGFAQGQGGVSFLADKIPTGPAALVLVGLLLLVLLGRYAIDVTIDPLVDAMSRLPWEQVDAGRLRYAVDLLETARIDAVTSGRSVAGIPIEVSERLAVALEDGGRALAVAGERLSVAAETLGAATRSAVEGLEAALRESVNLPRTGENPDDVGGARFAPLPVSVEAASAERRVGVHGEVGSALVEAVERLLVAAEMQGAATRSASERIEAALRESALLSQTGEKLGGAGETGLTALRASVEALTAELGLLTILLGAGWDASAARPRDRFPGGSSPGFFSRFRPADRK